jgi:hypothetical protein
LLLEKVMNHLARRIARNGLIAAVVLAIIGLGFAEVASLWMSSQSGRGAIGEATTAQALRYRLPLGMAGWGFVFVVITEVGLHLWRGRRPKPELEDEPASAASQIPAAVLIEQILREAEVERLSAPSAPSPSSPASENSPVPPPSTPA